MMGRTDQATRIIRASPSALYRAFEDPGAMERWLPPKGMTGHMKAFDFRDGGIYRMRLTHTGQTHGRGKTSSDSDEVEVRFVRLVRDQRIEQAVTFDSEDPRYSGVMRVTWAFSPAPSGTEVTVRCENVPEGIGREDHEAGLASTLDNLAAFTE